MTLFAVLGGISIFFLGLKTLSQALQALGTDVVREIVSRFTKTPLSSFFVGLIITILLQSSTVTTVMVVSFVNAEIMTLRQAIGVIFGANVGSTLIGWIMSVNLQDYTGILLLGGLFESLFKKKEKVKLALQAIFGLGLLFLGLQIIQRSTYLFKDSPLFYSFIQITAGETLFQKIFMICMGCLGTIIFQSSAVTLGLTMSLANSGYITLDSAVLFVLGENVGTTATAFLAAVRGNISAKRAALSHGLFNVLGVSIFFFIYPFFLKSIENFFPLLNISSKIATIHTSFNLTNAILFLPFVNIFEWILLKTLPEKKKDSLRRPLVLQESYTPMTAILRAQEELKKMNHLIKEEFLLVKEFLKDDEINYQLNKKIQYYENLTDQMQQELFMFFCEVNELPLSKEQSLKIQGLMRIGDELENIADYLEKIAVYKIKSSFKFNENDYPELYAYFLDIFNLFKDATEFLSDPNNMKKVKDIEKRAHQLGLHSNEIRKKQMDFSAKNNDSIESMVVFADLVISLRKIKSHSVSILQAAKMSKIL